MSTKKRGRRDQSGKPPRDKQSQRPRRGQERSPQSRRAKRGAEDSRHCVVGRRFVVEAIRGGTIDRIFVHDVLRREDP